MKLLKLLNWMVCLCCGVFVLLIIRNRLLGWGSLIGLSISIFGVLLAMFSEWFKRYWVLTFLAIVLIGLIDIYVSGIQSKGSDKLLKDIKESSDLSLNMQTGGDSFCYLKYSSKAKSGNEFFLYAVHSGKYPLSGVRGNLYDLTKMNEQGKTNPVTDVLDHAQPLNIGDIPSGIETIIDNVKLDGKQDRDFVVFLFSKNSIWHENIRLRYVGGKWVQQINVFKPIDIKKRFDMKEIFTYSDPGYPNEKEN